MLTYSICEISLVIDILNVLNLLDLKVNISSLLFIDLTAAVIGSLDLRLRVFMFRTVEKQREFNHTDTHTVDVCCCSLTLAYG